MFRGRGVVDGYEWLSGEPPHWDFCELITLHFTDRFLLIACFDSGPITPNAEERRVGWRSVGGGMLSPPLGSHLTLPADGYDEWWIFEDARTAEGFPTYDCFVNYGTWTLRSPAEIESSYDPTWERGHWDFLNPLQERFWRIVAQYRPLAYVAHGDLLTLASRDQLFLDAMTRERDA